MPNSFGAASNLRAADTGYGIFRLNALEQGRRGTATDIEYVARNQGAPNTKEISYMPARAAPGFYSRVRSTVSDMTTNYLCHGNK